MSQPNLAEGPDVQLKTDAPTHRQPHLRRVDMVASALWKSDKKSNSTL